jgi:hypothetical protein
MNYIAPLRTVEIEAVESDEKQIIHFSGLAAGALVEEGRPPPAEIMIHLQSNISGLVEGNYEFRSTRNLT